MYVNPTNYEGFGANYFMGLEILVIINCINYGIWHNSDNYEPTFVYERILDGIIIGLLIGKYCII